MAVLSYGASAQVTAGDGHHRMRDILGILKNHFHVRPKDFV